MKKISTGRFPETTQLFFFFLALGSILQFHHTVLYGLYFEIILRYLINKSLSDGSFYPVNIQGAKFSMEISIQEISSNFCPLTE